MSIDKFGQITKGVPARTRQTITYDKGQIYQVKIEKMDAKGNIFQTDLYTDSDKNGTIDVISHLPNENKKDGIKVKDEASGIYTIKDESYDKKNESNKILTETFENYKPSKDGSQFKRRELAELQKVRLDLYSRYYRSAPEKTTKIIEYEGDYARRIDMQLIYKRDYDGNEYSDLQDLPEGHGEGFVISRSYSFEDVDRDGYLDVIEDASTKAFFPKSEHFAEYSKNNTGNNVKMGIIEFSDPIDVQPSERYPYINVDGDHYMDYIKSSFLTNPIFPSMFHVDKNFNETIRGIFSKHGWNRCSYRDSIRVIQGYLDNFRKIGDTEAAKRVSDDLRKILELHPNYKPTNYKVYPDGYTLDGVDTTKTPPQKEVIELEEQIDDE